MGADTLPSLLVCCLLYVFSAKLDHLSISRADYKSVSLRRVSAMTIW